MSWRWVGKDVCECVFKRGVRGQRERLGGRENPKHAPYPAQTLMWDLISWCWDHDLRRNQKSWSLNWLRHPGTPKGYFCFQRWLKLSPKHHHLMIYHSVTHLVFPECIMYLQKWSFWNLNLIISFLQNLIICPCLHNKIQTLMWHTESSWF